MKLSVTPMDGFKPRPKITGAWKPTFGEQSVASSSADANLRTETLKKAVDTSFNLNPGLPPVGFSSSTVEELKRHLDELETVKENLKKKVATQLKQADILLQQQPSNDSSNFVPSNSHPTKPCLSELSPVATSRDNNNARERRSEISIAGDLPSESVSQSFQRNEGQDAAIDERFHMKNVHSGGFGDRFYMERSDRVPNQIELASSGNRPLEPNRVKFDGEIHPDFDQNFTCGYDDVASLMNNELDLSIQLPPEKDEEVASEAFSDSRLEDEDRQEQESVNVSQEEDHRENYDSEDNSSIVDIYPSSQLVTITAELSGRDENGGVSQQDFREQSISNTKIAQDAASSSQVNIEEDIAPNEVMTPSFQAPSTNLETKLSEVFASREEMIFGEEKKRALTPDKYQEDVDVRASEEDEDPGRTSELTTFRQLYEEYHHDELLPFDEVPSMTHVENGSLKRSEESQQFDQPRDEVTSNIEKTVDVATEEVAESSTRNGGMYCMSVFSPMTSVDVDAQSQKENANAPENAEYREMNQSPEVVAEYESHSSLENAEPRLVFEDLSGQQGLEEVACGDPETAGEKTPTMPTFPGEAFPNRDIEAIEIPMSDYEDVCATRTYTLENNNDMVTYIPPPSKENTFVDNRGIKISTSSSSVPTQDLQGKTPKSSGNETKTCPSIEEAKRIARIFSTKYS